MELQYYGSDPTSFDFMQDINSEDLLPLEGTAQFLEQMQDVQKQPPEERKYAIVTQFEPHHWDKFPNLANVDTPYQFDIHVDRDENINWLFQPKLGKIYIKINSVMNLSFSYVPQRADPSALCLRAMIVFSSSDEMHLPVRCCPNHRLKRGSNQIPGANEVPPNHILKCCDPSSQYHGEEMQQTFGKRTSLVVPLGVGTANEDGFCTKSIGLEFLCQNSCANGIQRKQTVVVFTLENQRREILGKKLMHFKVCSCPKRDMLKELGALAPSKKREASAAPHGKHPSKMMCTNTTAAGGGGGETGVVIKSELSLMGSTTTTTTIHSAVPLETTTMTPYVQHESAGTPPPPPSPPQQHAVAAAAADKCAALTFLMPNSESALHVLRCAFNEITGMIAKDKANASKYNPYARHIENLMGEITEKVGHK